MRRTVYQINRTVSKPGSIAPAGMLVHLIQVQDPMIAKLQRKHGRGHATGPTLHCSIRRPERVGYSPPSCSRRTTALRPPRSGCDGKISSIEPFARRHDDKEKASLLIHDAMEMQRRALHQQRMGPLCAPQHGSTPYRNSHGGRRETTDNGPPDSPPSERRRQAAVSYKDTVAGLRALTGQYRPRRGSYPAVVLRGPPFHRRRHRIHLLRHTTASG